MTTYARLHDMLSDMIESGRLTRADIPDDFEALVHVLTQLANRPRITLDNDTLWMVRRSLLRWETQKYDEARDFGVETVTGMARFKSGVQAAELARDLAPFVDGNLAADLIAITE